MAVVWTLEATRDLLSCWGSKRTQRDLLSITRNRVVYEDIARSMQKKGHDFTWKQCRTKIKNLTQSYRRIKDSSKETHKKELAEPFLAELDVVFNRTPAELNTHGDSDRDSDEDDSEITTMELTDTTNTTSLPRAPDTQSSLTNSNPTRQPLLIATSSSATNPAHLIPSLPLPTSSSGAASLFSLLMPTLLNTRPRPTATPLSGRAIAQLNTPTSGHSLGQGVGTSASGVQAGGVVSVQGGSGLVERGWEAARTAGGRGTQRQGEGGGGGTQEQEEQEEQSSPLSTTGVRSAAFPPYKYNLHVTKAQNRSVSAATFPPAYP